MDSPRRTLRALVAMAALIVLLAGLRAARTLLVPFLFAVVLAVLVLPVVFWLEKRLPRVVAVLLTVLGVLGVLVLAATITGQSLQEFTNSLPQYQEPIQQMYTDGLDWLAAQGLDVEVLSLDEGFDPSSVMGLVGATLNGAVDILSNTLLVTITMAFILAEASAFPDKLQRAFPERRADFAEFRDLALSVQRYLFLKTVTSGMTGLFVGIWTLALGLDFFVLWGFLAFLLNYIPTIGSIVAAIPAVLLAIVQLGPGMALIVAAGYLAINVSIGNVLEPRIMGDSLGLSPLVVFLSLVFWGWLWGPAGMLLSVLLTVMVRDLLANRDETRWLAVLLGPNRTLILPRLDPTPDLDPTPEPALEPRPAAVSEPASSASPPPSEKVLS